MSGIKRKSQLANTTSQKILKLLDELGIPMARENSASENEAATVMLKSLVEFSTEDGVVTAKDVNKWARPQKKVENKNNCATVTVRSKLKALAKTPMQKPEKKVAQVIETNSNILFSTTSMEIEQYTSTNNNDNFAPVKSPNVFWNSLSNEQKMVYHKNTFEKLNSLYDLLKAEPEGLRPGFFHAERVLKYVRYMFYRDLFEDDIDVALNLMENEKEKIINITIQEEDDD